MRGGISSRLCIEGLEDLTPPLLPSPRLDLSYMYVTLPTRLYERRHAVFATDGKSAITKGMPGDVWFCVALCAGQGFHGFPGGRGDSARVRGMEASSP